MRSGPIAALIAVLVLTPGCLGSVTAATIPEAALQDANWRELRVDNEGLAGGLAPATLIDYGPRGGTSGLGHGVTVATTVNLPLVDEGKLVPLALVRIEERKGIEFANPTSKAVDLVNRGVRVTGTEYDIRGGPAPGKALLFQVGCDDFVVTVAWGASVSAGGGGLFGGSGGSTLYEQAVEVARRVQC